MPAPAGVLKAGPLGISVTSVYAQALAWVAATPGTPGSLGVLQVAVLALALFANVAFLYTLYLPNDRATSLAWKVLLVAALVVAALVAWVVPPFASLPAYWIWLVAMALVAVGFVAFDGAASAADKQRDAPSEIDRGEVPKFVWALLAFTLFWITVSAIDHAKPPPDAVTRAITDSLTTYVNDRAHVLSADEASRLSISLQTFEATTPSQLAIAIYPSAPGGSIDDFTLRAAEQFPLGRAGHDTGAILFVFLAERTARLEVGYGLEGTLTDVAAHRLLEANLAPAFARGAYYDGLNATLEAIVAVTGDAYRQAPAPDTVTTWKRKLAATRPTRMERAWRGISQASLAARVGSTLLGALIAIALFDVVWRRSRSARGVGRDATTTAANTDWGRFVRDIGRGIGNLCARRPFTQGLERFDASTIVDTLRMVFWIVVLVVPVAGVLLIAGGGEFGGAGALIHW